MSEIIYQSKHSGKKIDDNIDLVDAHSLLLEQNTDEINTHKARVISQYIKVTRDASIEGVQTITLSNKPKRIQIRAHVPATKKFSLGVYSEGGTQNTTYIDGTSDNYYDLTRIVVIQDSIGNYTQGLIQNVSETGFEIVWSKIGTGGTGAIQLNIDVIYH